MTPIQLIQAAKSINASVNTDYLTLGRINKGEIGIQYNKQHTWHWFKLVRMPKSKEYVVWFNHSYSQLTGETHSGFKHGFAIESRLNQALKSIKN